LTARQCISKLTRRTWGPAKFTPELREHLEGFRRYYHFVRSHESLEEDIQPVQRKGKQPSRKYRQRTPAMLAGITDRRWTVKQFAACMPTLSFTGIEAKQGGKDHGIWHSA
jgi:hypothetical protein